jgi:hypothetical protein
MLAGSKSRALILPNKMESLDFFGNQGFFRARGACVSFLPHTAPGAGGAFPNKIIALICIIAGAFLIYL